MYIEHKMREITSIEVPRVEGIANTAIQLVVDEDMGRGKVPRNITKEYTNLILK